MLNKKSATEVDFVCHQRQTGGAKLAVGMSTAITGTMLPNCIAFCSTFRE